MGCILYKLKYESHIYSYRRFIVFSSSLDMIVNDMLSRAAPSRLLRIGGGTSI
jgi:hypothetical protein